jgi:hypothetical protein
MTRYTIATGNPFDGGMQFHGVYSSHADACADADESWDVWWIVEIIC